MMYKLKKKYWMRLLGIDYGTKRVGVSISDDGGRLAFPHTTLSSDKELINELRLITDEYKIERIIVGESKDYQMKDNAIMGEVSVLVEELTNILGIEVVLQPEFMTTMQISKEHFQATKEVGRKTQKKDRADNLDAKAATLILQSYIDSNLK